MGDVARPLFVGKDREEREERTKKVVFTKEEIIDTLKTLEGVKRKLQAALKRN